MNRVVRCLIAAPAVLIALLLAGPAVAANPHPPALNPGTIPLPAADYCQTFDAVITIEDFNQYVISETTDPVSGGTTFHITGRARATVTNLDSLESVSYNISGPGTLTVNPDGTFSGDLAGPNLLWTTKEDLGEFADEVPTVSYTTGHVTFAVTDVDPSGAVDLDTTSYSLAGGTRQTDVCAVLA
jgi:hypothetical protein